MNCDNTEKNKTLVIPMGQKPKAFFVTFEHRLNRLVFPKSVQGRAKAGGMGMGEKRIHALFSECLHPLDDTETACPLLEKRSVLMVPLTGISCLKCYLQPLLTWPTSNRNYRTILKKEYTRENTAVFRG